MVIPSLYNTVYLIGVLSNGQCKLFDDKKCTFNNKTTIKTSNNCPVNSKQNLRREKCFGCDKKAFLSSLHKINAIVY